MKIKKMNEDTTRQTEPYIKTLLKTKEIYHLIYTLEVHITSSSTNTIKGIVQSEPHNNRIY